ncbi:MAG TPA: helix-turn-helix transcriptional regulator [Thermoanaerobaculia bacterium]|nr:helix-turn-helix transcriptional regulator [Thermoanaerobaculia bacterium]
MGAGNSRAVIEPRWRPLPYPLPRLPRRRPRAYEEWAALRQWGKLPAAERHEPGYLLRQAREAAGLTQADLAGRLGCSQQAVAQAERWGGNPTFAFATAWAEATGHRFEPRLVRGSRRA